MLESGTPEEIARSPKAKKIYLGDGFRLDEGQRIKKEEKIIETKHCYVYPDKYPLSKGHLLIVTKKHYESIMEMPDEVLCDIIKTVKLMEKRLTTRLKVKGMDFRENYRPFLPESELRKAHIHFHIIPRTFEDLIYGAKGEVKRKEISEKDKDLLINKLK
jgi:histidine triad (HIT) family protein